MIGKTRMSKKITGFLLAAGTSLALAGCAQGNMSTGNAQQASGSTTQTDGAATVNSGITEDAAKAIALSDAGVQAADVTFTKVARKMDDGYDKYEVEFYDSQTDYDYDIDAVSGAILGYSRETTEGGAGAQDTAPAASAGSGTETPAPAQQTTQPDTQSAQATQQAAASGTAVSDQQALTLAISAAGVAQADVSFSRANLEYDDDYGKQIYDVEFHVGRTEYSYDIDAETGAVLSYDIDTDD